MRDSRCETATVRANETKTQADHVRPEDEQAEGDC